MLFGKTRPGPAGNGCHAWADLKSLLYNNKNQPKVLQYMVLGDILCKLSP